MMRFEGTEKKLELVVSKEVGSLRKLDSSWWNHIVTKARAKILSSVHNEQCSAYLLSESSLFVYDDFMTMITCGDTSLVDATLEILKSIPEKHIPLFFYERKNPIFPQSTSFYDDLKRLQNHFDGTAYRFGDLTTHHICLFHKNHKSILDPQDMTLEILMHEIDSHVQRLFSRENDISHIRSLGMHSLFSFDFQWDEHFFTPSGYSLNGIRGHEYYTFHVTPSDLGSYVSFETNHIFTDDYHKTIEKILSIFKPKLFDIFQFQIPHIPKMDPLYHIKSRVRKKLGSGHDVQFYNFYQKQEEFVEPYKIL